MEHRRLGNSGLKVSPICLGAMMFGDQTDEAVARHTSTPGYTDPKFPVLGRTLRT